MQDFIDDLSETLYEVPRAHQSKELVAAPQLGRNLRIIIIRDKSDKNG